jgi:predicted dehydrogenase
MKKIKMGIIGYGYWGPNLTRNFMEIPDSDVLVVSDLDEDRLKKLKSNYSHINVTTNYHDLFTMGLEAVAIATPPVTHYKIAMDCMDHGLHVLVEKPITVNSVHAEKMIEIAKEKDLILMVGHTFEFNGAVHTLKKLIKTGELGNIYYLDSARLNLGLFQNGLNVIWGLAPHDISILNYLMECTPLNVSAQGTTCVIQGLHDTAYINLRYPNDILAHIHVSWLDPCKVRRITVVGSKKMAVYNDVESLEKIKIFDEGVETPVYTGDIQDFKYLYRYGDILIPNIRFTEPLRLECQHFLDCITNHTQPISNGEDGLRVVKIIEAAQQSLVNNGREERLVCKPEISLVYQPM